MTIFTPDDEPYLGLPSLLQFDKMLVAFITEQHRIAGWTHSANLTALQRAASEIVPAASSIVLSIRELVRQGYLLSALILTRPLFERVATLSYLIENPSKVELWAQGWPHKTRPTLKERLGALSAAPPPPALLDRYNGLVHGDPDAALHGAVLLDCGRPGFTIGKDIGSPQRADDICGETVSWLVVLHARCVQLFPGEDDLPAERGAGKSDNPAGGANT